MVALSALGMPATADPSTLAGVALRSSFPLGELENDDCREGLGDAAHTEQHVGRIGAPVWRSALPATPVQTIPLRVAMAANARECHERLRCPTALVVGIPHQWELHSRHPAVRTRT